MSLTPSRLLQTHLGLTPERAGTVRVRVFRSILVTEHRTQELRWTRDVGAEEPYAAVLFSTSATPDGTDQPFMLFVPPGQGITLTWPPASEIVAVWISLQDLRAFITEPPLRPVALHPTPITQALRAFTITVSRAPGNTALSRYAIERLLAEMLFVALVEARPESLSERAQASLVNRAQSIMLLHREDPGFTVADVASELHVSLRNLQRAFAKSGKSPSHALRSLRLGLAEAMLRNSDYDMLTIDDIAAHSGFSNGAQLRRALVAEGRPLPKHLRRGY